MFSKFSKVTALVVFLTVFAVPLPALAQSEGGGNAQSPVQVIVQIVFTAAVLKVLKKFDLP